MVVMETFPRLSEPMSIPIASLPQRPCPHSGTAASGRISVGLGCLAVVRGALTQEQAPSITIFHLSKYAWDGMFATKIVVVGSISLGRIKR